MINSGFLRKNILSPLPKSFYSICLMVILALTVFIFGKIQLPVAKAADIDVSAQAKASPTPAPTPFPSDNYPSDHFSLIAIPDTQFQNAAEFQSQAQWILNNQASRNIAFMVQEGDVTETAATSEWKKAYNAYSKLNGIVPYAIAVGNHDYPHGDISEGNLSGYNKWFPESLFSQFPWFGGVYHKNHMENSYFLFSAGGEDWLVLVLEFEPSSSVVSWAKTIVAQYPNRHVILVTHSYMGDGTHRDANGLWNNLVKVYANFSLVLSGHIEGTGRRVDLGTKGNQVYQMLADYQNTSGGGDAYFRILDFYPSEHKFTVSTYSPYVNKWKVDSGNQFEYDNVDFLQ